MAIESFPPVATGSNASVQPVGSTGTYNLAVPLTPGLYKITTDTTQSFSTAQLYFATSEGFRFGAVVRGGQGYVAVPQTVTTVTFASGTFPLLIGFEKFDSYQLIQAPINPQFSYSSPLSPYTGSVSFTAPPGATSIGIYWPNGTFTDFSSTSSPQSITYPTAPTYASAYPALLVAKDANGVWGLGFLNADPFPFAVYTSSGTFTALPGRSIVNLFIAAGGGGGGALSGIITGGGGGAGQVISLNSQTINTTVPVTVGSGGTGGSSPAPGGTTSFGNISAIGGGRGSSGNIAASPGSSGGGGGGTLTSGASGTPGAGFAGGNAVSGDFQGSGGGGSINGAGSPGSGRSGGPSPAGNTQYGFTAGRGGGGGAAVSGNFGANNFGTGGSTYAGGGGGGGAVSAGEPGNYNVVAAASGNQGIVIVQVI
jgi:hypothetical protein